MYKPPKNAPFLKGFEADQKRKNRKRTKQISRKDLSDAVQRYLKEGKQIEILDPTIDYFGDEPVDNWMYNDTKKRYKNHE